MTYEVFTDVRDALDRGCFGDPFVADDAQTAVLQFAKLRFWELELFDPNFDLYARDEDGAVFKVFMVNEPEPRFHATSSDRIGDAE